jgi:uncharacterized protein (DUF2147 family)
MSKEGAVRRLLLPVAIAGAMLCGSAAAGEPTGTWITQTGDSKISIVPCGGGFCGNIVWLKEEKQDTNNPDPALRGRSLVGLRLFSDMQGSGNTYSGKLYNPRDGKTYSGKLKTVGADKLDLAGCVLAGLVCKHEVWTKAN